MNGLNEIGGTSVSDVFSSFFGEASEKSMENLVTADSSSHEEISFGSCFDSDVPQRMTWPCHGFGNLGQGTYQDIELFDEAVLMPDDAFLSYSFEHILSPFDQGADISSCLLVADEEDYNPYSHLMSWQDLPPIVSPYWPHSREPQKGLPITLVLDLDETLVHSSFNNCKDADFSFPIHSKMQVQTVFVRQRPYLQMFLEAVSSMFDIVIFTAGHSIYAERLLDILDPNQNLIGQRVYRDSCVFTNGGYLKDLTILGRDLAKIAIVDNTPQVFQLQVENGIPIESWFGDPSDSALISLLFFLETLVGADDVRPLIKSKFG